MRLLVGVLLVGSGVLRVLPAAGGGLERPPGAAGAWFTPWGSCVHGAEAAMHASSVPVDTLWERVERLYGRQDYAGARYWLDSVGRVLIPRGDSASLLKLFSLSGNTYYAMGQVSNAIQSFRTAIAYGQGRSDDALFSSYASLGTIYSAFNFTDDALRHFQKADSVLEAAGGNADGRSSLFLHSAELYLRCGQYERALEACYDAQVYLQGQHVDLVAILHAAMAEAYGHLHRLAEMKSHVVFALGYVAGHGSESLRQEVFIRLAHALQSGQEGSLADSLLREATRIGAFPLQQCVRKMYFKVCAARCAEDGRYAEAASALDAYIRCDDSMQNLSMLVKICDATILDALHSMQQAQQYELEQLRDHRRAQQRNMRNLGLLMACIAAMSVAWLITMRAMRAQRMSAIAEIRAMADRLSVVNANVEHRQAQLVQRQTDITQRGLLFRQSQVALRYLGRTLRRDLSYVSHLQRALLPSSESLHTIFGSSFALYLPRDVVSGDFYSCHEVGGVKILAVLDCAGHGIPGALLGFIGNILMRKILQEERITDPSFILTRLHQLVKEYLGNDQDDGVGYYTMDVSVAAWHARARRLVLSSANRTAYLFTEGEMRSYRGVSMSIGSVLLERDFINDEVTLPYPAMLYLATDGFADQMDNANRKFGSTRFVHLLTEGVGLPMEQQCARLRWAFDSHRADAIQTDDVCVVGIGLG